jgi:hypothetical protein
MLSSCRIGIRMSREVWERPGGHSHPECQYVTNPRAGEDTAFAPLLPELFQILKGQGRGALRTPRDVGEAYVAAMRRRAPPVRARPGPPAPHPEPQARDDPGQTHSCDSRARAACDASCVQPVLASWVVPEVQGLRHAIRVTARVCCVCACRACRASWTRCCATTTTWATRR